MDNEHLLANSTARSIVSTMPLVRLITAAPIVAELDRRDLPTDQVLEGMGLSREALFDAETFVHAMVMYQFLENAAEVAGEKHFSASIGEQVDLSTWLPTVEVAKTANTLGDLLFGWCIGASEHSSAIQERLEVHGQGAVLSGHRSFETTIVPAQVDGFLCGFCVSILRHAMGRDWKPSQVLATVSDPDVLPPIFHGIKAIKGDHRGHKLSFPAKWLSRPFDRSDFQRRSQQEAVNFAPAPAKKIVDSIAQALRPYINDPRVTIQQAADICGMKPRAFSRLLTAQETNLTTIINHLKQEYAEDELAHSDNSVANIATDLGYSDPTSFARSFKKWTNMSPREFRQSCA